MVFYALRERRENKQASGFLFANSNMGISLTFLGILATLFSSFTLQGMPSFFAKHGVGAWIFLGISDVAMGGFMIYFGLRFRHLICRISFDSKNITEILKSQNHNRFVVFFYLIFTTIFLLPYIAVQIKGAAMLFSSVLPVGEGYLFWSCAMVILMFLYSSFGGIRAIYITDAFQGIVMLLVVWIIAFFVLDGVGGVEKLFNLVASKDSSLLSLPGPKGLLTWQFLLISFIAISLMPYTQPQLTTRLLLAKNDETFIKAGVVFCVFVILVIIPTVVIGFKGSIMGRDDFLIDILNGEIPPLFYALFVIGVLSASMSTSDSQLMAIGTEWASFFSKEKLLDNAKAKFLVKFSALICSIVSLVLAQSDFKSLVLFAVNSFVGTSFLLPVVYSLKFYKINHWLVFVSFFCVSVFLVSLFGLVPKEIVGLRVEIWLYLFMICSMAFAEKSSKSQA